MLKKYKEEWEKILKELKENDLMSDLEETRQNFLSRTSKDLSEEDLGLLESFTGE